MSISLLYFSVKFTRSHFSPFDLEIFRFHFKILEFLHFFLCNIFLFKIPNFHPSFQCLSFSYIFLDLHDLFQKSPIPIKNSQFSAFVLKFIDSFQHSRFSLFICSVANFDLKSPVLSPFFEIYRFHSIISICIVYSKNHPFR